jgi:hypothetical protein
VPGTPAPRGLVDRIGRRMLAPHLEWLDEVEREPS